MQNCIYFFCYRLCLHKGATKEKKRNEELNTVQYNATIVDQLPSV